MNEVISYLKKNKVLAVALGIVVAYYLLKKFFDYDLLGSEGFCVKEYANSIMTKTKSIFSDEPGGVDPDLLLNDKQVFAMDQNRMKSDTQYSASFFSGDGQLPLAPMGPGVSSALLSKPIGMTSRAESFNLNLHVNAIMNPMLGADISRSARTSVKPISPDISLRDSPDIPIPPGMKPPPLAISSNYMTYNCKQ